LVDRIIEYTSEYPRRIKEEYMSYPYGGYQTFGHFGLPDSGLHLYYGDYGRKIVISSQELTAEQYYYATSEVGKSPISIPLCIFCNSGHVEYRMVLPTTTSNVQISYYPVVSAFHHPYIKLIYGSNKKVVNEPIKSKISEESATLLEEFLKTCNRLFR
jgi:hypothetical protein